MARLVSGALSLYHDLTQYREAALPRSPLTVGAISDPKRCIEPKYVWSSRIRIHLADTFMPTCLKGLISSGIKVVFSRWEEGTVPAPGSLKVLFLRLSAYSLLLAKLSKISILLSYISDCDSARGSEVNCLGNKKSPSFTEVLALPPISSQLALLDILKLVADIGILFFYYVFLRVSQLLPLSLPSPDRDQPLTTLDPKCLFSLNYFLARHKDRYNVLSPAFSSFLCCF